MKCEYCKCKLKLKKEGNRCQFCQCEKQKCIEKHNDLTNLKGVTIENTRRAIKRTN